VRTESVAKREPVLEASTTAVVIRADPVLDATMTAEATDALVT
jgi:hypothetical protein